MKCLVAILLTYFVFTSGLIFELIRSEDISYLNLPYSIALSAERTGIAGVFTENDVACAEWLATEGDKATRIYADANGFVLLTGWLEPYKQLQEVFIGKGEISEDGYLLLTEWNVKNDKMVMHTGQAGLRGYEPLLDVNNKKIVFQSGEARIYR